MGNEILTTIAVIAALASIINTIIQSRKVNSEKGEIEANITKKLQEVYSGIIDAMQKRIDELEDEIKTLKQDDGKWKKLFYRVVVLLEQNSCKAKCPVREKVNELLSKENETL